MQAFAVPRPTVARALDLRKRNGWLVSRQGYGTIIRGRREVVERKDRRGREALEWDESQGLGHLVEVGHVSVPARNAWTLGLPHRAGALMRRFLIEEDDEAVEPAASYFPVGHRGFRPGEYLPQVRLLASR